MILAVNCGYKDYIVSNKPTSWFDAHILCLQAGMTLATVENREEQHCLEKELDKVPNPRSLYRYELVNKILSKCLLQGAVVVDIGYRDSEEKPTNWFGLLMEDH